MMIFIISTSVLSVDAWFHSFQLSVSVEFVKAATDTHMYLIPANATYFVFTIYYLYFLTRYYHLIINNELKNI